MSRPRGDRAQRTALRETESRAFGGAPRSDIINVVLCRRAILIPSSVRQSARSHSRLHPRLSSVKTLSSKNNNVPRGTSFFLEQVTRACFSLWKTTDFAIINCSSNFAKNDYQPFFIRKIPPRSSTLLHYLCQNKSRTYKTSYFYFGAVFVLLSELLYSSIDTVVELSL